MEPRKTPNVDALLGRPYFSIADDYSGFSILECEMFLQHQVKVVCGHCDVIVDGCGKGVLGLCTGCIDKIQEG
jgi:hypothetical protein